MAFVLYELILIVIVSDEGCFSFVVFFFCFPPTPRRATVPQVYSIYIISVLKDFPY